jgi:putative FmdB family regulatory protein
MPAYDLICKKCNHEWEGYSMVAGKDKIKCPSCNKAFGTTLITCKSDPSIWCIGDTAYNESAGVTYTGPQDLKNKVKEAGLQEI